MQWNLSHSRTRLILLAIVNAFDNMGQARLHGKSRYETFMKLALQFGAGYTPKLKRAEIELVLNFPPNLGGLIREIYPE